jgi:tetratricopeptide (TPR) repeat protein
MISYAKAIHALHSSMDDVFSVAKESLAGKNNPELKVFADHLKANEPLKFIFRSIMDNLIGNSTKNAVFFAETLLTLMEKNPIVIYILGECYFANSDWLKVYQLFQNHNLLYQNDNYLVLAARALLHNKQYTVCEAIINKQLESKDLIEIFTNSKLRSTKFLVLAKCQEVLEKKKSATANFFESLKSDPTNVEALNLLMDNYLVTLPESRLSLTFRGAVSKHYPVFIREHLDQEVLPHSHQGQRA